ncbi:porin family protein [Leptobacterium sp. I13]|uniref:porin family protein n=1 Tax=Leptobacterium meishanense TaxID=3128904 RepID=UPI0030EB7A87
MKVFLYSYFILFISTGWAQVTDSKSSDSRYLEDQFYVGVTYNILLNRPSGVTQSSLPYGLQIGYIKDLPVNKKRTIGFGVGIGYATNSYYHNLRAIEQPGTNRYQLIPDDISFKRNKIETHLIELPIEFRLRTSTSETYKFWRIYGGVKFAYIFANSAKFVGDERVSFSNDDLEKFQYDLYFSFGYNTWNFYAAYGLNDVFKSGIFTEGGEELKMNTLKIGLIFYLL